MIGTDLLECHVGVQPVDFFMDSHGYVKCYVNRAPMVQEEKDIWHGIPANICQET